MLSTGIRTPVGVKDGGVLEHVLFKLKVRALPADTLEAIHLKLILGRRYTDDFEFDKELLDGMLKDLGAVTCFRGSEVV